MLGAAILANHWLKVTEQESFRWIYFVTSNNGQGFRKKLILPSKPIQHGANITASSINLLLAKVTYDNAYAPGAGTEAKLRAHTLAIGVFSDIANTIAKFREIEATLVRSIAQKAGGRIALGLEAVQFIGGGVGGMLGMLWFGFDSFDSYTKGYKKDSLLDFLSAVGCAVGAIGLAADSTIIGLPVGLLCNIIGISLVMISQILKYFRVFNSDTEDLCKRLVFEKIDDGGSSKFESWNYDVEEARLTIPAAISLNMNEAKSLVDKVSDFIADLDTYDQVMPMI